MCSQWAHHKCVLLQAGLASLHAKVALLDQTHVAAADMRLQVQNMTFGRSLLTHHIGPTKQHTTGKEGTITATRF